MDQHEAMSQLGVMYFRGHGVEKDTEQGKYGLIRLIVGSEILRNVLQYYFMCLKTCKFLHWHTNGISV
jgi:hypothetical protein